MKGSENALKLCDMITLTNTNIPPLKNPKSMQSHNICELYLYPSPITFRKLHPCYQGHHSFQNTKYWSCPNTVRNGVTFKTIYIFLFIDLILLYFDFAGNKWNNQNLATSKKPVSNHTILMFYYLQPKDLHYKYKYKPCSFVPITAIYHCQSWLSALE